MMIEVIRLRKDKSKTLRYRDVPWDCKEAYMLIRRCQGDIVEELLLNAMTKQTIVFDWGKYDLALTPADAPHQTKLALIIMLRRFDVGRMEQERLFRKRNNKELRGLPLKTTCYENNRNQKNPKSFKRCWHCKGPQHNSVCLYPEGTFKGMTYDQVVSYVGKHPH